MKVKELEDYDPLIYNFGWLIIKTVDNGAKPDFFDTHENKKIKKAAILWYKRMQILNLDEEFKYKDAPSLKKISLSIGLKKHQKNRKKLIYQMKEKIMQKNWKSIDKIYEKIRRK